MKSGALRGTQLRTFDGVPAIRQSIPLTMKRLREVLWEAEDFFCENANRESGASVPEGRAGCTARFCPFRRLSAPRRAAAWPVAEQR